MTIHVCEIIKGFKNENVESAIIDVYSDAKYAFKRWEKFKKTDEYVPNDPDESEYIIQGYKSYNVKETNKIYVVCENFSNGIDGEYFKILGACATKEAADALAKQAKFSDEYEEMSGVYNTIYVYEREVDKEYEAEVF